MRVFTYIFINLYTLLVSVLVFVEKMQFGIQIYKAILGTIVSFLVINLLLYSSEKILGKLFDYILKKYEQRKMKNYNLFDWMGDSNWIKLYSNLQNVKQINKESISDNIQSIKKEVMKEFNNLKKLESLKILLEVKIESPKLTTLNSTIQTVLIALVTYSFVSIITSKNYTDLSGFKYIVIGLIVWFMLLGAISFISKQIDKFRFLYKIVLECINDEKSSMN